MKRKYKSIIKILVLVTVMVSTVKVMIVMNDERLTTIHVLDFLKSETAISKSSDFIFRSEDIIHTDFETAVGVSTSHQINQ